MADESEAHELRREIAYLSGLINSAKNQLSNSFHNGQIRRPADQFCSTWNQPYNYHNHYKYNNNYSITRFQKPVPFPKSTKFVANISNQTQSGKQSNDSRSVIFKNSPDITPLSIAQKNTHTVRTSTTDTLHNLKTFKSEPLPVRKNHSCSQPLNPPFRQKSASCVFIKDSEDKPESNQVCEHIKMHVNPKFLKRKITENVNVCKSVSISSSKSNSFSIQHQNSSVSANPKTVTNISQVQLNTMDMVNVNSTSVSNLVMITGCTKSSPESSEPDQLHQSNGSSTFMSSGNTTKTLKNSATEMQIKDLRESLGYEIPDEPPPETMDTFYRKRNNESYCKKQLNKNVFDPYYHRKYVLPLSQYKLDKKIKSIVYPHVGLNCKINLTELNRSKYVLNRSNTIPSSHIYTTKSKFTNNNQYSYSASKKYLGISKTQHVAKTIISKYKIRKVPDTKTRLSTVKQTRSRFINDTKSWRRNGSYTYTSSATKFYTAQSNNWENRYRTRRQTLKINPHRNVYSWNKYSSYSFSGRQRGSQYKIDQHHIQRKLHSLNKPFPYKKTSLKFDRRNGKAGCRLVFINGFLYRSTNKSMTKTGSKKVDNRRKSASPKLPNKKSVVIKNLSGKQMKTVKVRGVTFHMAADGHSLHRIRTGKDERTSSKKPLNEVKVTRVDIGGVTYIQTKPGTLVRMTTTRTRAVASRVINKSISTVTNKLRKKVNKQYCIFYNRFGKCNREEKCPHIHDPEKIAVCTRFLRGTCNITDCLFSHKAAKEKMPVCSYFLKSRCMKDDCPYLHVKVNQDAAICLAFINGYCPRGKECKKLHSRLCPEYTNTGICSNREKCRLQHKKYQLQHKKNRRKSKEIKEINERYFSQPTMSSVKEDKVDINKNHVKQSTALPEFISLAEYGTPQLDYKPPHIPSRKSLFDG
ncbi:hypothetical protein SNE40_013302 [Patella caerulea]